MGELREHTPCAECGGPLYAFPTTGGTGYLHVRRSDVGHVPRPAPEGQDDGDEHNG